MSYPRYVETGIHKAVRAVQYPAQRQERNKRAVGQPTMEHTKLGATYPDTYPDTYPGIYLCTCPKEPH